MAVAVLTASAIASMTLPTPETLLEPEGEEIVRECATMHRSWGYTTEERIRRAIRFDRSNKNRGAALRCTIACPECESSLDVALMIATMDGNVGAFVELVENGLAEKMAAAIRDECSQFAFPDEDRPKLWEALAAWDNRTRAASTSKCDVCGLPVTADEEREVVTDALGFPSQRHLACKEERLARIFKEDS